MRRVDFRTLAIAPVMMRRVDVETLSESVQ
jgi:hypothetical protein